MAKRKKRSRYGDGVEERNGKFYGVWLEKLSDGGYKRHRKLCENAIEARQWADENKRRHNRGRGSAPKHGATFADTAEWYRTAHLIPPIYENGVRVDGVRDWKNQRAKLAALVRHFGSYRLTDITETDLAAFVRKRRHTDNVTTATINRDLSLMRSMFIKANVTPRPKFPINHAAESERDRVLSFDEEKRLLSECVASERVSFRWRDKPVSGIYNAKRSHLRLPLIMAVDTAMRKGEMMKLLWSDVDLDGLTITVRAENAKTGKERKVGITPRLAAELAIAKENAGESASVFTSGNWHRAFKTACRRASVENLRWHDLRHTATTRMIRAGIPHTEVMKITGHTQMKTFLRYLNVQSDTVVNAAQMLGKLTERENG